jgi:Uma2 family endonuclease
MVQIPIRQITLAEFLEMPETKPASEYFDSQIVQKPMPQGQHSIIQRQLLFAIDPVLSNQGIGQAFPELRCNFANKSIVPDVAVFESFRIPENDRGDVANVFEIAPDWAIEILSPGQSATKVLKKIKFCLAHGTQMGWLIDPEDRSVIIMGTGQVFDVVDDPAAILPVPEFAKLITDDTSAAIELTISDIFGWLQKQRPKNV